MVNRTEAIKKFLAARTQSDLAALYSFDMEVQVNVAQDGGERIDGEFKGRKWHGWTDGLTTWKSFRIPYKANSNPEYTDKEIRFDLDAHAEGIGMTGWDWKNKVSRWVAYDFDAIVGHSTKHLAKLTEEELDSVRKAACDIPWVSIRRSTSGKGLHLYVFLDPVPTANHNEHAALSRAILGQMAALTGFDFHSKVDVCGGNMWVWHRKMRGTNGLQLIKKGDILDDIPPNWRDHVKVIKGTRRKNLPQDIEDKGYGDVFEELTAQRPHTPLDNDHKALINFLKDNDALWWWDSDHHMLITHTYHLQEAYDELQLKGYFQTGSKGDNLNEQNCFAFPLRKGAWAVRRYTPGVREHESWEQDGAGWTRCYLNRRPDLGTACRAYGGVEDPKGGFIFREAEVAIKAAELLGVHISIDPALMLRKAKLKQHKSGKLIVEIDREATDRADEMQGWLAEKNKPWTRMYAAAFTDAAESDTPEYDDLLRHLITASHENYGWVLKINGVWANETASHVKAVLASMGYSKHEQDQIVGSSILKAWKIVAKPFQPEYPGSREWNRNAVQFRFPRSQDTDNLSYPTWLKILDHCGSGLDHEIKNNPWCKANGILTGGEYLKCWIASLFQYPSEPLPYLFLYGPQNSGKSILHEAISLLLTGGVAMADTALTNTSNFNAELEGKILCVVEETDLRSNKAAYDKIKSWVTGLKIQINKKFATPYETLNVAHFIQCANDYAYCPMFSGDTRITMCFVDSLSPIDLIPKKRLLTLLEKEAPDFLASVVNLEIPECQDRLNIPVIDTYDKEVAQTLNANALERYLSEAVVAADGYRIKFSDFYDAFFRSIDANDQAKWTKRKVAASIPPPFLKARSRKDNHVYIGNAWWKDKPHVEECVGKYVADGGYLSAVKND